MRSPAELREELDDQLQESLFSEAPTDDPGLDVRRFGTSADQPIRYFFYADVIRELIKAARYRSETATAMLLGRFCMDDEGPFAEVTAFDELEYLYGADLVEQTRPRLESILDELGEGGDHEGRHVVGVFAARPGGEARLDEATARLHLSLFNLPYQPVLVCDGERQRLGLYGRGPEEPFFNAGFSVVERAGSAGKEAEKNRPREAETTGTEAERTRSSTVEVAREVGRDVEPDHHCLEENLQ